MNWLDDFKIALIEEDEPRLASLAERLPTFESVEEMEAAMRLISQAKAMLENKKERIAKEMREIEGARKFLTSSDDPDSVRLDVTS
jgi:hypothetical protein